MLAPRSQRPSQRPAQGSARAARESGAGADEHGGEWWELNELGTILHGQRTGATLRLGEGIDVCVARVDAPRGRVDLIPPAAERGG